MDKKMSFLKTCKVTEKGCYWQLWLKFGNGYPVAIEQKVFNGKKWNPRLQNFLLANAKLATEEDFKRVDSSEDPEEANDF